MLEPYMRQIPPNYAVRYQYYSESTPPPEHYEYTIWIGPGSAGKIVFCPDYHEEQGWAETFRVEDWDLERLYSLMLERKVFTKDWSALMGADSEWSDVGGGDLEFLQVTSHGNDIEVSCHSTRAEHESISQVYAAIKTLVPDAIWEKLMEQQEEYRQDYFKPVVGSLLTDTGARAFMFDPETGRFELDVYTQLGSEARLTEIQKRRDENRVRSVPDYSAEGIRIGEYLCENCGTWATADRHQWSIRICVSCAMDRASEMGEYYRNLPQTTYLGWIVTGMVRMIKRMSRWIHLS